MSFILGVERRETMLNVFSEVTTIVNWALQDTWLVLHMWNSQWERSVSLLSYFHHQPQKKKYSSISEYYWLRLFKTSLTSSGCSLMICSPLNRDIFLFLPRNLSDIDDIQIVKGCREMFSWRFFSFFCYFHYRSLSWSVSYFIPTVHYFKYCRDNDCRSFAGENEKWVGKFLKAYIQALFH